MSADTEQGTDLVKKALELSDALDRASWSESIHQQLLVTACKTIDGLAGEIKRLQEAKRRALALADTRAKEAAKLRQALEKATGGRLK